jgi:hypothetical protein
MMLALDKWRGLEGIEFLVDDVQPRFRIRVVGGEGRELRWDVDRGVPFRVGRGIDVPRRCVEHFREGHAETWDGVFVNDDVAGADLQIAVLGDGGDAQVGCRVGGCGRAI